jgi:hypothetical protein
LAITSGQSFGACPVWAIRRKLGRLSLDAITARFDGTATMQG